MLYLERILMDRKAQYLERYKEIIPDWPAFLDCIETIPPKTFWINTLKGNTNDVLRFLTQEGVVANRSKWNDHCYRVYESQAQTNRPGPTMAFRLGLIHLQEEVSQLPVVLLNPQPTETLLDLCAAPGNKSIQAAVQMQNQSSILANDVHRGRIKVIRTLMQRLGICNISSTTHEGTSFPLHQEFDTCLVDVPCSCEGNIRQFRNKGIPIETDFEPKLLRIQYDLLKRAVALTKPGGRLVYSTCTFNPDENEAIVHRALQELPIKVRPVSLEGFSFSEGITHWNGQDFHPAVSGTGRIWPHLNNTGGFYLALLEKGHA